VEENIIGNGNYVKKMIKIFVNVFSRQKSLDICLAKCNIEIQRFQMD